MTIEKVFIAVGSNIDPERNIPAALDRLAGRVRITGVSAFYRTRALAPPRGAASPPSPSQPESADPLPPFLNGVVRIETAILPRELKFGVLRGIEADLGRMRGSDRYAPRTIDLDILLYGDLVLAEADLVIPDPGIRARPFIAVPLLELDPGCVLPDTGESLAALDVAGAPAELEADLPLTGILQERIAR